MQVFSLSTVSREQRLGDGGKGGEKRGRAWERSGNFFGLNQLRFLGLFVTIAYSLTYPDRYHPQPSFF